MSNHSIDLATLAAYPGEFRQELIKKMYNAFNFAAEGITVLPGIKSKETLHKLIVRKGLKPYTGTFLAKAGDVYFEPREITVEKAQRDIAIEPSKYLTTFMEKRRGKGESATNMTIPFAEFMWNSIMEENATEVNISAVYHGVGKAGFAAHNPATAYVVGDKIKYVQDSELRYFECVAAAAAGQTPDTHPAKWEWAGGKAIATGFGKIIADEIAAGDLTPVATGAVTNVNAYDKFTQMFRAHSEPVKMGKYGKVLTLCSMTDYENLTDDYENKIKKNFEEVDGVTYLAKTNKLNIIQPVSWLTGSRRLISTLSNNLIAATDQLSDLNVIKTIEQMYHIEAGLTFMLGFQIQDLEALRVNDQP